jgi:hypothetical protein
MNSDLTNANGSGEGDTSMAIDSPAALQGGHDHGAS